MLRKILSSSLMVPDRGAKNQKKKQGFVGKNEHTQGQLLGLVATLQHAPKVAVGSKQHSITIEQMESGDRRRLDIRLVDKELLRQK